MNGYSLIRAWYDFKFENPDKVRHIHSDFYCYLVDQWNRLGQKEKFGLPTKMTMEVLGIGSYNTYKKSLDELIEFGFILLIQDSKNQHQAKVVALSKIDKATDKALDKATIKASDEATDKPLDTIDKQINKQTKEQVNKPDTYIIEDEKMRTRVDGLMKWLTENCPNVLKLKNSLTKRGAEQILSDYPSAHIKKTFEAMDNHKQLTTKYVSAEKTFKSWASRDFVPPQQTTSKDIQMEPGVPMPQEVKDSLSQLTGNAR